MEGCSGVVLCAHPTITMVLAALLLLLQLPGHAQALVRLGGESILYPCDKFPHTSLAYINYTEKLLGYRYMDANNIKPRFEFGFGLSYTTFAYSGPLSIPSGSKTVTFTVKNTGDVVGVEFRHNSKRR